jgi:hypothetical protein
MIAYENTIQDSARILCENAFVLPISSGTGSNARDLHKGVIQTDRVYSFCSAEIGREENPAQHPFPVNLSLECISACVRMCSLLPSSGRLPVTHKVFDTQNAPLPLRHNSIKPDSVAACQRLVLLSTFLRTLAAAWIGQLRHPLP